VAANPEAIAWYVQRSERLLDDLRDRIQAFRTRGIQLAGFSGAILALAGANVEAILSPLQGAARYGAGTALLVASLSLIGSFVTSLLPRSVFDLSGREVANYTAPRFIEEPDLWRVHVRVIRAMIASIERSSRQGDEAAAAIRRAELLLSGGLAAVGVALAILVLVVTF
jgi:hypothetical protein